MKKSLFYLLLGIIAYPLAGQEIPEKKNNLSVAPLLAIDRTIPISYSRYINDFWNYTLYARYRFIKDDGTSIEPGFLENSNKYNQPYIYSRIYFRTGFQYHKNLFLLEPLLQLDYGWLEDQVLVYDADGGDYGELQDRKYYSVGLILLAGTYHNFEVLRIRTFVGIGGHLKHFEIHAKEAWNADPSRYPYQDEYYKFMPSVHLGLEIGINF